MTLTIEILYLAVGFLGAVPVAYLLLNAYLARKRHPAPHRAPVPLSEVTAVVPVHAQDPGLFCAAIESVARQGCAFVVVGDESLEPYRSMTEERGGRFVHLPERSGKKGAPAAGLAQVRTPLVLLVDSDTVLPDDAAREMASYFGPGVGGVGANLSVRDTGRATAYCGEFVERAREVVLRAMSTRGSVLYLDGACTMYRTELIRPFVESAEFHDLRVLGRPSPLGDDWQLTDHVLRAGYATVKAYDVHVVTQPKATVADFVRQNVRWSRSNWIRLGRFLRGRGPRNRGAFFAFEVVGTYGLPLITLATLLSRIPLWMHAVDRISPTVGADGLVLLRMFVGLPRTMSLAVARGSLTVAGAFATGVYLGTLLRNSRHPAPRMVAYGALSLGILFVTALYGLATFWKRPVWNGERAKGTDAAGRPVPRSGPEA